MNHSLKRKFFEQVLHKKISVFMDEHSASLASQLNKDIPELSNIFTREIAVFLRGIVFFIGSFITLMSYSPILTVIGNIPFFIIIFKAREYITKLKEEKAELSKLTRAHGASILETLKQIRTVKLFNAESFEIESFRQRELDVKTKTVKVGEKFAKLFAVIQFLILNVLMIVLGAAVYVKKLFPDFQFGNVISFGTYSGYFGFGFVLILMSYIELSKISVLYSNIKSLILNPDTEEVLISEPTIKSFENGLALSIRNLSFKYPHREFLALESISLDVRKGDIIGIIGQSGHGKSTLFHLITKLYQPIKGQIFFNDKDISDKPA